MDVQSLLSFSVSSNGFSAPALICHQSHVHPSTKRPVTGIQAREPPIRFSFTSEHAKLSPPGVHDQNIVLLRRSIRILLTRGAIENVPASFEEIYSACRFTVCVSNKGEGLFEHLKIELEQCVNRLAAELAQSAPDSFQWTSLLVEICKWFGRQISLLKSLLTYLDQSFIRKTTKLPCVRDLAFMLFAGRIFQNPQIAERLRSSIQVWTSWERQNRRDHPSRHLFPDLVSYLITHGQHESLFEHFYIDITRSFYQAESTEQSVLLEVDGGEFMAHVNWRVEEESQRAQAVLPKQSWSIVEEVTEKALLDGRLAELATKALGPFMDARRMSDLTTLNRMFTRVDAVPMLCAAFKAHVVTSVQNIVQDETLDDEMVQRLLNFKALADLTLSTSFADAGNILSPSTNSGRTSPDKSNSSATATAQHHHSQFNYALIDAFQTGFKTRRNKPAEMIAKYMDKTMREPTREISDAEFEKQLDAALALYRFTDDKDIFRTFYHRALARRLLLGKSASDDDEKLVLKKLKEQYDPEFGMGDHMFNDLALSRELTREHHSKLQPNSSALKLSVMVLQQSVWPFAVRKTSVDLPLSMQTDLTNFVEFYKTKHQGRKLDWDHALGTATLKARFIAGPKEVSVSLYQAVVLLLFNDATELPFTDILEQTNMGHADLQRTLQSLACGKKKVLKKIPAGRDVVDSDVFRFNAEFTDPRPKFHINSIQVKETPEESKRARMTVESDRKYYLDAAIVRIMKARKELSYEQLKMATIAAVKSHFVPEVTSIKERVQVLVEQDYLKRDEDDMTKYIYVA